MSITWLHEPFIFGTADPNEPLPKIAGYRPAVHADLWILEALERTRTVQIFGDVSVRKLFESSCMTLVLYDELSNIVSGVCLFTYPNVPSVPSGDWPAWITSCYGIENADETSTIFIHYLVWDDRHAELFLKDLLVAIFRTMTLCSKVILVRPPWDSSSDSSTSDSTQAVFEQEMKKIVPTGMKDSNKIQVLYLSTRDVQVPRLKIRRVVEEDNDDVVPIIEAETSALKEHYGDYYISEMVRNPDGHRQIIVSHTNDGTVNGVMCLNDTIEIDLLTENFELGLYHGLRKPHPSDEIPPGTPKTASQILYPLFSRRSHDHTPRYSLKVDTDDEIVSEGTEELHEDYIDEEVMESMALDVQLAMCEPSNCERQNTIADKLPKSLKESIEKDGCVRISELQLETLGTSVCDVNMTHPTAPANSAKSIVSQVSVQSTIWKKDPKKRSLSPQSFKTAVSETLIKQSLEGTKTNFLQDVPPFNDQLDSYNMANLESKMRTSLFGDTMYDRPRGTTIPDLKLNETLPPHLIRNIENRAVYYGTPNAFVLELFAFEKGTDEGCGRSFLEATFECFPDLDYCVMLVPFSQLHFPFLEQFTRIPLRCNKDFPMTLYVVHKAVLFGKLKSREAESYDRDLLVDFLDGIPKKDAILIDFDRSMDPDESDLKSYVFECSSTIIGLAIVCSEKHANVIKRRYYVEEHVSMRNIPHDSYGRILHVVLMPVFSAYHRYFFLELTSMSQQTILFYRLYESDSSALTRNHPLITCLNSMIPVMPRRPIEYTLLNTETVKDFGKYEDLLRLDRDGDVTDEVYALYMISPRLAMMPMSVNDVKIVVVGASDCGVAFLESLALRSLEAQIRYTNLTLISPNGLPFEYKRDAVEASMLPFRGRYCYEYRHLIGARAWVNLVYGTVISINRKDKYVTVMNQGNLTYDYLILTCGLQYQKPIFPEEAEAQNRGEILDLPVPWNCLTMNDDTEVSYCVNKIRLLTNNFENERPIVFYGSGIECYCAIHGLLEFGVDGSWITLIEPPLHKCEKHDSIFFDDPEVDTAIMNGIRESGVTILSEWNMIDWVVDDVAGKEIITSVRLMAKGEEKEIQCDALLSFCEKSINKKIFLAICRAGLVFDGQLVIDPECRTNDPFVFAAGTVTKYSRKFHAEAWQHKHYNSIEIGESLAKFLREAVDRFQRRQDDTQTQSDNKRVQMVPRFRMPISLFCTLPGSYYYLHVRKPGKRIPPWEFINNNDFGQELKTGSCNSEVGYFKLVLNAYDSVKTVTCVSRKAFEVQHMIALYGKHQSMLNEIKLRHAHSQITDFYAYFREPWAVALYHDMFDQLRNEFREILQSKFVPIPRIRESCSRNCGCEDTLIADCIRALKKVEWAEMLPEDRQRIKSRYAGSVYHRRVEDRLLDFLQFAEEEMPMYLNPRILRQLYADIEDSPLYFNVWS